MTRRPQRATLTDPLDPYTPLFRSLRPGVRIVGIEPEGAPTHHASRAAGRMVTLDAITTVAGTLAPRRTEAINFELVSAHVDDIVLVSDDAMREAARWLWFECGLAAELSGAAGVAALMSEIGRAHV